MRTTLGQIGPSQTPGIIRTIIIATSATTLLTALVDPLIFGHFHFSLQYFLSLSASMFKSLYLWQPFTYLFVLQPYGGITFGLIFSLFFQMLILWMMGAAIAERYGEKSFSKLYFGSGILAGLLTLPYYLSFPHTFPIAGPTASLYAVFVVWCMLHQEAQILLFFIIPVKAKWLLVGGLAASLLVFLSEVSVLSLILLAIGTLYGYLYAAFFKETISPYPFLNKVDRFFINFGRKSRQKKKESKIVKFPGGKREESDEEFVDRMLDKISKKGADSLTKKEQDRLDKISKGK